MADNVKKDKAKDTSETKRCFVMMPFSTPEGYEDNHFQKVYEQIISPAVIKAGFEPFRVDQNKISDSIIKKIFEGIITSEMAICDLSSRNPNVLYELGLRHAFDKPVVLICDKITKPIFDVSGVSIIGYRHSRLYDEVLKDQEDIATAIKATAENESGYSVVNIANITKADETAYTNVASNSEINTALITRLISALEKREQYTNKPDWYISGSSIESNVHYWSRRLTELESIIDSGIAKESAINPSHLKAELERLAQQINEYINMDPKKITAREFSHSVSHLKKIGQLHEKLNLIE